MASLRAAQQLIIHHRHAGGQFLASCCIRSSSCCLGPLIALQQPFLAATAAYAGPGFGCPVSLYAKWGRSPPGREHLAFSRPSSSSSFSGFLRALCAVAIKYLQSLMKEWHNLIRSSQGTLGAARPLLGKREGPQRDPEIIQHRRTYIGTCSIAGGLRILGRRFIFTKFRKIGSLGRGGRRIAV